MAIRTGQKAPNIILPSTSGKIFDLYKDLDNQACIIYFYPKDFTRLCTAEACEFRDAFPTFRKLSIPVLGISRDDLATHLQFKEKHDLPFELLSDIDGKVFKKYKALIPFIGIRKRITYLIDKDHHIRAVYENMFSAEKHIKSMTGKLRD